MKCLATLLLVLLPILPVAAGEGLDLHWLWDDRCAECHGHSADFARRLAWRDGELQVRHPVGDPIVFLHGHYPPDGEVEALYRMLQAQAATPPRFRRECGGCHAAAAQFARRALEFRDGELLVTGNGPTLAQALAGHRGLSREQQTFYLQLLTRVAREVHRPPR